VLSLPSGPFWYLKQFVLSELPAGGSKLGSVIPEHPPLVFKAKLALQVKHLFPSRV
jgi:hypothetical protein